LSHPSTIDGRDGVGTLVLLAAIVALVTAGFMETVGRRVMTHSSISAILLGGVFLPGLATALAFLATRSNPEGTDGGGILIFAALVLSIGALPVTLATSVLYVVVREKSLRANGL
jgi:drug/metabolite transporter (DMT)-like permease